MDIMIMKWNDSGKKWEQVGPDYRLPGDFTLFLSAYSELLVKGARIRVVHAVGEGQVPK